MDGLYIGKCNLEKRVVFLTVDQIAKKLKEPNPIFIGELGNGKMFDARKVKQSKEYQGALNL